MKFKKSGVSVAGLMVSLLALGSTAQAATTTTSTATDNSATRVGNLKGYEGLFSIRFYRVNKQTTVKLGFYRKSNPKKEDYRNLTLPKGTIISARNAYVSGGKWTSDIFHIPDVSYKLKQRVIKAASTKYYGPGEMAFNFKPSRNFTRVKRPAWLLPYGNSMLVKGGLSAIKQLPAVTSDAVKLTTDGYIDQFIYTTVPSCQM